MTRFRVLVVFLIVCLFATSGLFAGSGAKRWAGRGAAGGAILGLLVGGDLGGAAAGAAIGQDNTNALDALVDCQYDRAALLAKAGATSENPDFALAGYWLEALVAVDSKDQATAESLFAELVDLDDDVDSVQQASVAADQAILKTRETRSVEGISCER